MSKIEGTPFPAYFTPPVSARESDRTWSTQAPDSPIDERLARLTASANGSPQRPDKTPNPDDTKTKQPRSALRLRFTVKLSREAHACAASRQEAGSGNRHAESSLPQKSAPNPSRGVGGREINRDAPRHGAVGRRHPPPPEETLASFIKRHEAAGTRTRSDKHDNLTKTVPQTEVGSVEVRVRTNNELALGRKSQIVKRHEQVAPGNRDPAHASSVFVRASGALERQGKFDFELMRSSFRQVSDGVYKGAGINESVIPLAPDMNDSFDYASLFPGATDDSKSNGRRINNHNPGLQSYEFNARSISSDDDSQSAFGNFRTVHIQKSDMSDSDDTLKTDSSLSDSLVHLTDAAMGT